MEKLMCIGRDNVERKFECTIEKNTLDGTYDIMVQPVPPKSDPNYELRLKEQEDGNLRIISVTHHGLEVYKEKGIIDALIPSLAKELDADIVSSPRTDKDDTGTFRTCAADKYWERLRGRGMATYDSAKDIYTYARCASPGKYSANEGEVGSH